MKRLISFTMALLICLLSLTACGEVQQEETQKTDDTAATPTETEAETISLTPNWDAVEKTNLNGISIDIACPGASLTYYDALDVEEITGDQLNDAIYNRNRALEEQMDFKLNALPGTGAASALVASVTAGSGDWDLALALIQGNGATLLKQGYLRSFNSLENVDMTMPWWDQSAIDTMAVNGQMFFGMMDFSVDIYESLTVLFYNGELIDRFQLEDPYALYQESAWTIDKMLEMIETVANDENGDGKFDINTDVYGLSGREYGFQPIFFSSGMEIVTFNDEEQKFQHNLTDERYVAIAEAVAVAIIAPPVYFALQPHKKVVGVDLGASGTKIVLMRGTKFLKSTKQQPGETLEEALVRFNPEDADCITVTGVGAAALPDTILGKKVVKVDEFASLYRGASITAKRLNMIVASVGTGTAFVRVTPFGAWHLGGSGVGGGMLLGLSEKLFGKFDPKELQALAAEGKPENCDLLLKDVTAGQISNLTPETTVANLSKAGTADDASLARGIYTLIFQSIGVMGAFCTKAHLTRTIFVCGTILDSQPIAKEMLDGIAKLHKVKFVIPENAAFITAIGSTRQVQS